MHSAAMLRQGRNKGRLRLPFLLDLGYDGGVLDCVKEMDDEKVAYLIVAVCIPACLGL